MKSVRVYPNPCALRQAGAFPHPMKAPAVSL